MARRRHVYTVYGPPRLQRPAAPTHVALCLRACDISVRLAALDVLPGDPGPTTPARSLPAYSRARSATFKVRRRRRV